MTQTRKPTHTQNRGIGPDADLPASVVMRGQDRPTAKDLPLLEGFEAAEGES